MPENSSLLASSDARLMPSHDGQGAGVSLKVPEQSGAVLAVPEPSAWRLLAERNAEALGRSQLSFCGESLASLRAEARRHFLLAAAEYHAHFEHPFSFSLTDSERLLILTGHQPAPFHAGVLAKSFAVDALARSLGGISGHILADNDTLKSTVLDIPSGTPDAPLLAHVAFDRNGPEVPLEERHVAEEEVFARFGTVAVEHLRPYGFESLVGSYWGDVRAASQRTGLVGDRLAAARRVFEGRFGCWNAELPLRELCAGEAFVHLLAEFLQRADEVARIHNELLAQYRREHRVRSRNHPVPALEERDGWIETPFWVWSSDEPSRRHLFVRPGAAFELGTVDGPLGSISGRDLPSALRDWVRGTGGWKIRPRALVTTLYFRLFLADLFVHGIGGGKYDALTDEWIRRLFGIAPPPFAILTATCRLPIAPPDLESERLKVVRRIQRDLVWNPDRYLADSLREQEPVATWIEQKFERMEQEPIGRAERRARWLGFRDLNSRLRSYLATRPRDIERERGLLERKAESHRILSSREFPFFLHGRATIEWLAASVRSLFDGGSVRG